MRSKLTHTTLWLLFLLLGNTNLLAQDFKTDMEKVGQKMASRRLSVGFTYKLYDAHVGGKLLESQEMEMKTWDLMVSMKTSQFHTIKNKQQYLHVDFTQKTMLLNKVNNYKKEMNQYQTMLKTMLAVDSFIQQRTSVKVLNAGEKQRTYRITYNLNLPYAYSDITINTVDYTLQKVVLYYKQSLKDLLGKNNRMAVDSKPRIEMVLSNLQFYKKLNPHYFATDSYVVKKGKSYLPQPNYQQYEFINYLNN